MNSFKRDLVERLALISEQGLFRELRIIDSPQSARIRSHHRTLLNFSSNDYLGLANHPQLKAAAAAAINKYGVGAGASRLICGSLKPYHQLEELLADFKGTEAALTFSSGYSAAIGVICALLGKEDVLVLDKLVHASIVDAARLCGAALHIFRHNDMSELEDILKSLRRSARERTRKDLTQLKPINSRRMRRSHGSPKRVLIVTETIFSMDGDCAPLRQIVSLKEKYGAWLMVDEAHATGLYGPNHRGIADALSIANQIEVQMGTLGKAIGAAGGYVCGSQSLINLLINRGRPFIFTTAPVPAAAGAAIAGIELVRSAEGDARRNSLWSQVSELSSGIEAQARFQNSAIFPLMVGEENEAVRIADALRKQGIFIPAIRYPTVGRGEARLRLTVSASHTKADVKKLVTALSRLRMKANISTHAPSRAA